MGRPRKQPQDRVKKDAFSGPRYLLAAAKQAARVEEGNDFSPWVVAAIREKLERDVPGLVAKMRAEMQAMPAFEEFAEADAKLLAAAEPEPRGIVRNKLAAPAFANLPLPEMQKELARMEAELKVAVAKAKTASKEKPKA